MIVDVRLQYGEALDKEGEVFFDRGERGRKFVKQGSS